MGTDCCPAIDLTHATRAEQGDDLIVGEASTGSESHGSTRIVSGAGRVPRVRGRALLDVRVAAIGVLV